MRIGHAALWATVMASAPLGHLSAAGSSCESLSKLAAANTSVTMTQVVAAGGFRMPEGATGAQGASRFASLPAFCRVAATLTPTPDSDIKIEVWMPASGWNGKFEAVGNGGWAGTIGYPAMHRPSPAATPPRPLIPATARPAATSHSDTPKNLSTTPTGPSTR